MQSNPLQNPKYQRLPAKHYPICLTWVGTHYQARIKGEKKHVGWGLARAP